jgi:parallel beta-helix repeat protein
MKKLYSLLIAVLFSYGSLTAQVMTQTFSSIPSTWVQSNSCSSTSTNASWKLTTSNPGYGASGYTDNTGVTGSYAMWVDGSSPYPCDVSITTDSIDPSTLTAPSLEFYWFKNNTSSNVGNNTLTVELFDGQSYQAVWSGSTDSAGWRKVQVDMSCISMPNDIALRFTVSKFNGSASFYNDVIVDDIKVQELPTGYSNCAAPTAIAVGTVTGGSATATVSEGCNSSATTTVIYGLAGFNPSSTGSSSATVSNGTATLSSLASSSTYDAYAVTSCGTSSYSDTLGPITFVTPCAVVTTPYSENFDNSATGSAFNPSLPVCWDFYVNTTSSSYYPYFYNRNYSFYANSGSNFLYGYRSSSSSTSTTYADTTMIITPEIQGLDSATKQLEFYARTTSAGRPGEVIIGLTDAAGTPSSFNAVDTVYATATAYNKYTIYLDGATTGDARIAFMLRREIGVYDYICIDDVSVTDIPPCPEPIGLSLTGTTQTTGTISWSSSSAAFNIEVGPMGFTQGTGTSYSSTTTSYTATGLTQNTYYDAYVMANCTSTGDGTSNWVGPFTFKTECGDQLVPYSTGFEGFSSGNTTTQNFPDCWAYAKTGTSTSLYSYNYNYSFYANGGTNSVRFYGYASTTSTNSADGDTLAVFSPRISGLSGNDKQVIFNLRTSSSVAYYTTKMIIATADSNASLASINIIDTVNYTSTYTEYTVDLDNVASNASRVVFMIVPEFVTGYTYAYSYAYLDDIEIRDIPNCPIAVNAMGVANSDSSATLTWVDSSAVTNYIIEWGPSGFTQGTGAPTDTVTGTSWSINTLDDATTYDFYIQSNCMSTNGSMSPWVGPITVDVPCSPTAAPFADGFENKPAAYGNSINPNLPDCWTYSVNSNPGNSYSYASTSSFSSYSGTGYVYNRQSNVAGDTVVVSLPMIEDLNQGGLQIKFWARTSSTTYPGQMSVATTDASGNYSTAVVAKNMNVGSTTYQQYSVYLDSSVVTSDSRRPAFLFYSASGSYNYIYLDSVEVEAIPACINYNQMASNVSSSSADLTWNYTGTNCFNVEYGPAGFIQGTGVGALSGMLDTNVTAPYSLTGLNPNTGYDFYVQNCCSSTWEGPFTFQTECTGPLAAGTYSVGPTGDFATLDSVMSTLNVCGIGGAVTFEFQSGLFSASSPLGEINGSSMTNTITFKGSAATNDTIAAASDAVFVLEGAKYMNFEDLLIYAPTSNGFRLNGASDISITGNTIMSSTTSTSSLYNGIVASNSSTSIFSTTIGEKNITITDNDIVGGYYGVRFYGSFAARNENVEISGNTFSEQYYYGIYMYYGIDVTIDENHLSNFRNNFAYGVYPYQVNGLKVTKNHVSDVNYGIWAYYTSTTAAASFTSEISNNMLDAGNYGLTVYYGDSVNVFHNTARGSYGLRDYYNGSSVNMRNNIFEGSLYAFYAYNSDAFGDYNLYYSTGTYLGYHYVSSPYALTYVDSVGELQSLDTTMHMSSIEGDPIFAGPGDLHVFGPLANDAGDNSVGVTEDIDGDARPMSGSTTVDIGADEYDVVGDDAALTALLGPSDGVCGSDSLLVSVEIANYGQNTLNSLSVSVDIFGTTMTATPTNLGIPFGGKDTVELGYASNYVGGIYAVTAYTVLTNDGRPGNDTLSTSIEVSDAQQVSPVYPDMICAGDDITLSVTIPTQGNVMWTTGNDTLGVIAADSSLTLTNITTDTTITVSAVSYSDTTGNVRGIGTGGGNYNFFGTTGVLFSVTKSAIIDSVTLYPNAAGTTNIAIQDVATGATVWTGSASTTATGNTAEQVYLGATVTPGSYRMVGVSSTTGGLYREFGVSGYPYSTSGGEVSITQGSLTNYHYFFYDWVVTVGGCEREDSTFTVGIYPDAVAAISIDTANATISATDWMANWSTAGTTDADSIYVEFSNGTSSNDTSGTVTFTANNAGETVTVIAFGPCSSDTATFTFDVNQISVDEDFLNGTLSIYPNPTRGLFNVEFATATATNVEISIVNMVGQVISNEVVTVNGLYNNQFDLSDESAGVYFIKFTTDEGVLTERITVE